MFSLGLKYTSLALRKETMRTTFLRFLKNGLIMEKKDTVISKSKRIPPIEETLSNKKMTPEMTTFIEEELRLQWSPVQISGRLKKEGLQHVSHETIYKYIWADKKNGGSLLVKIQS